MYVPICVCVMGVVCDLCVCMCVMGCVQWGVV